MKCRCFGSWMYGYHIEFSGSNCCSVVLISVQYDMYKVEEHVEGANTKSGWMYVL